MSDESMDLGDIPMPEVLDAERDVGGRYDQQPLDDSEVREQMLRSALAASCGYGQQLWNQLTSVRSYLVATVPSATAGDDEWERWRTAYTTVTCQLAGPHGDSGYGAQEARRTEQQRRA